MKYTIELNARAKGVQLLALDEDEKDELLEEESLDDIYMDWVDRKDYDFYLEGQYLMPDVDRFSLIIKDEEGNIVFECNDVKEIPDPTFDDDGVEIKGWDWEGVEDGLYLTRIQTIKGCYYTGGFELDEPFDKDKLYIIRDLQINDELMGDDVFPIDTIYYRRGKNIDLEGDKIGLEDNSDWTEEQYFDTYLMEVEDGDCWTDLNE